MSQDMTNVEFARENEEFADDIQESRDRNNWVVTIRFYSLLHYIEGQLDACGYDSINHDDREDNILNCKMMDNQVYKLYKFFRDTSRDARYECIRMTEEDVTESEEKLEKGKELLGFDSGGGSTKYST